MFEKLSTCCITAPGHEASRMDCWWVRSTRLCLRLWRPQRTPLGVQLGTKSRRGWHASSPTPGVWYPKLYLFKLQLGHTKLQVKCKISFTPMWSIKPTEGESWNRSPTARGNSTDIQRISYMQHKRRGEISHLRHFLGARATFAFSWAGQPMRLHWKLELPAVSKSF